MERPQQRTRSLKWQSPPPKILHLPRRPRKKASTTAAGSQSEKKERLDVLLEQERVLFFKERSKVEEEESSSSSRWKFQAEMLRGECDVLRMEREISVRKMKRKKLQLERTLNSTLHILISVRRKISEGKYVSLMVEEEIGGLMEKLKMSSFKPGSIKEGDFDKQVCRMKKNKDDEHKCPGRMLEIREMAVQSFCGRDKSSNNEGMLDNCSGQCKSIVQKIVEHVRVETEQWSQMQAMIGQVRDEIDELQTSRDFWEDQALNKDYEIQSLHLMVTEWRQKAVCSKMKVNELQEKISKLHEEMKKRSVKKKKKYREASQNVVEVEDEITEKKVVVLMKEKSFRENYNCRPPTLGDVKRVNSKRQPLADIGNSSSLREQCTKLGLRI